jgi:predicted membrane channel-forming protein YqfA (hemolysin III family)
MLTFVVTPQILIGFYFMFTGKWRPRVDFTFFLVAAVLIYLFSSFARSFGA